MSYPMIGGSRCGRRGCLHRIHGSARARVLACLLVLAGGALGREATAQRSAPRERVALEALYRATGGDNWTDDTHWLSEEPIGDWYGVTTDSDGRVTVLSLEENGLTGTLPVEIGNLSRLGVVVFWGNELTGPVPRALWSLPLRLVALSGNQVTGTLPPEVGELADLDFLDLGWTAMTGALPQSMTRLSLDFLRITGSYLCAPSNAAFQAWLETIGEYEGETCVPETGSVGADRAALVALYDATAGASWRNNTNWLSTRPLGEWYGVTTDGAGRVVELNLGWGGLTGTLPPEIGDLSRLRILNLYDNFDLTGPLPPEVGNLRRLEVLGVTSTALYGLLPASVCNLSSLGYLGLSWSSMRGPLPQCLTNLSELDSFGTWESFLCAPANAAFQAWVGGLSEAHGVHSCKPATLAAAPVALTLRGSAGESIAVTQTGGGAPVSWTATGTEPWLRVMPMAGVGTGRVTVGTDPAMLQAVGGSATGAVVVTADGASLRVPVTAARGAVEVGLTDPTLSRMVLHGLVGRPSGSDAVRHSPARAMRRFRREADAQPDAHAVRSGPKQEAPGTVAGDRAALSAIYEATGGGDWWRNTHWQSDRPLDDWYGVTTDADGRVTALELPDNRVTGALPDMLGRLTRLELLDLRRNALTGSMPAALGNLAGLRGLDLGFNQLTGAIPPGLGNLSNLESLNLQWNEFRSPIPPELGKLNKLEVLNLEFALVTGSIPPALGNLTSLERLDLQDNFSLTGPLPAALGRLTNLEWLSLGGNRLEGAIPPALGRLANLRELRLQNNSLSGGIPPELGNLSDLGLLSLHNNSLTGTIPPELGELSHLFALFLHENALTGPVPASLGNTDLYWLELYGNELTGAIPSELGSLDNLERLYLQDNTLTGAIPSTLGDLANLEVLDLRNNTLTGSIPAALGQLSSLEVLDLSDNELTGPIPSELGDLSNLWWLDLRDNGLAGPIPSELGSLSELVWLDLAGNGLSGPIPPSLGDLGALTRLSVWRNELTGSIPRALGTLPRLEQLYLGENALTGSIPAETGDLANLRQLYLAGNALSGRIPGQLGELASLDVLHLRGNALTGPLPSGLGSLSNLRWLDVAGNGLTGTLPSALGSLSTLRALSLTGNRLTGALPGELTSLSALHYLWIDGTGLCAPSDASFQAWLARLAQFSGAVCEGNRPPAPAGTLPNRRLAVDGTLDVDVSQAFIDPDGDALIYSGSSSAPSVVAVRVTGARVTLTAAGVGSASIRVTATDPGGLTGIQSFTASVTASAGFTDDPLQSRVTPIKAIHFTELRTRIDALRAGTGLGRFAWTDPVLRAGVTPVRLVHLLDLRSALAEAYSAAGRAAPRWTDASLASGSTPIRALHVTELRAAVLALEWEGPRGRAQEGPGWPESRVSGGREPMMARACAGQSPPRVAIVGPPPHVRRVRGAHPGPRVQHSRGGAVDAGSAFLATARPARVGPALHAHHLGRGRLLLAPQPSRVGPAARGGGGGGGVLSRGLRELRLHDGRRGRSHAGRRDPGLRRLLHAAGRGAGAGPVAGAVGRRPGRRAVGGRRFPSCLDDAVRSRPGHRRAYHGPGTAGLHGRGRCRQPASRPRPRSGLLGAATSWRGFTSSCPTSPT